MTFCGLTVSMWGGRGWRELSHSPSHWVWLSGTPPPSLPPSLCPPSVYKAAQVSSVNFRLQLIYSLEERTHLSWTVHKTLGCATLILFITLQARARGEWPFYIHLILFCKVTAQYSNYQIQGKESGCWCGDVCLYRFILIMINQQMWLVCYPARGYKSVLIPVQFKASSITGRVAAAVQWKHPHSNSCVFITNS